MDKIERLTVEISGDLKRRAKAKATLEGKSLKAVIEEHLNRYVGKGKKRVRVKPKRHGHGV